MRGATPYSYAIESTPFSFNPRAPCGARLPACAFSLEHITFQSTRPVRGATAHPDGPAHVALVSIHAPRAGRDLRFVLDNNDLDVSIHAPRAGRDLGGASPSFLEKGFNPRAPCGARLSVTFPFFVGCLFQSTRPVRGATSFARSSISYRMFQSTRPVRGATHAADEGDRAFVVSIHAPRAGRDEAQEEAEDILRVSIHAPRAGRDVRLLRTALMRSCFNPRAPCGARPLSLPQ